MHAEMGVRTMSMRDRLQATIPWKNGPSADERTPLDTADRIPIDELSGEGTKHAIEYLELLDRETTTANIEWAAAQLQGDDVRLATPIETLDERRETDARLVAPNVVEDKADWHVRDNSAAAIYTITSLPRKVDPGWLVPLTLVDADIRLSMHVTPLDPERFSKQLKRRRTQVRGSLGLKRRRGSTDTIPEEEVLADIDRLLRKTVKGTTKPYAAALYLEVLGDTEDELDQALAQIENVLAEQGIEIAPVEYRQLEAQGAVAPVCTDPIGTTHPVQLEALGTFFNAVEPPVIDPDGVLFGFDDTGRPVILDRYATAGHAMAIAGDKGSGKTYFRELELYRRLLVDSDVHCIVFDPAGDELVNFAHTIGGEVIRFGSDVTVNPLAISPPTDAERDQGDDVYMLTIRAMLDVLHIHFDAHGGLSAAEEGVLTAALHYAYLSKGIIHGQPDTYARPSPTMADLIRGVSIFAAGGLNAAVQQGLIPDEELAQLRELEIPLDGPEPTAAERNDGSTAATPISADNSGNTDNADSDASTDRTRDTDSAGGSVGRLQEIATLLLEPPERYMDLARQLEPAFEAFKPGGVHANLNGRTTFDPTERLVVFDMDNFADTGDLPLLMQVMLNWAYQTAKNTPHRLDITFDEAHYLLERESARNLINLLIRHARHFEAGLTLMSQTAHEFVQTKPRQELFDNCDITCLFHQPVDEDVHTYFDLSDTEYKFVESATQGETSDHSECLLITDEHGRRRLSIHTGPYEHHVLDQDLVPLEWLSRERGGATDTIATQVPEGVATGPDQLDETPPTGPEQAGDGPSMADGGRQR